MTDATGRDAFDDRAPRAIDPRGADARRREERRRDRRANDPKGLAALREWAVRPPSWHYWSLLIGVPWILICAASGALMFLRNDFRLGVIFQFLNAPFSFVVLWSEGRPAVFFFVAFFLVAPALQATWLGAFLYYAARYVGVVAKPRRRRSQGNRRRSLLAEKFFGDA